VGAGAEHGGGGGKREERRGGDDKYYIFMCVCVYVCIVLKRFPPAEYLSRTVTSGSTGSPRSCKILNLVIRTRSEPQDQSDTVSRMVCGEILFRELIF
jgi:hypothetical protein